MQPIRQFLARFPKLPPWLWDSILFPFLLTRLTWLLVAYFAAGNLVPNPSYPTYSGRGYFLTRIFPLDIFTRWDSFYYLSIVKHGYRAAADITTTTSSIPFFPLYPYLVKSLGWLGLNLPDGFYILTGLLLSNLLFLAAAVLLHRLITGPLGFDETAAHRALTLLMVFPASFFFSSFYPESLFLFLVLAGFSFAQRDRWLPAALCAALLVLTRPQGVVAAAALAWFYMEKRAWKLRLIRADVLWFALAPIALLLHAAHLYQITARPLAFIDAQLAWGRNSGGVLNGLWVNINGPALDVFKIDLLLVSVFLLISLYLLWKWQVKAYGVFALLMCLMPLSTGSLVSVSRFLVVIFPVFILLGEKLSHRQGYTALRAVWFALQIVYFAAWVNYYWIA